MGLKLRGKTCLMTGTSRGIGHGAAKILAAEGARVAMLARREGPPVATGRF
jgi:3-oxoacyl-[acyl-carrier protein] reductase